MMTSKDIEKQILQGESQTLEFKRELPSKDKKVLKTMVAFANGEGGRVVFGVDDATGQIGGIPDSSFSRLQDAITNMISDSCSPQLLPVFTWLNIEDKAVLVVEISPSPNCPYYLKSEGKENGTYIRIGATTRKADPEKVRELEIYGSRQTYDEIVELATEPAKPSEIDQLCKVIKSYCQDSNKPVGKEQLISWMLLKPRGSELLPSNAFRLLMGRGVHFSRIQCAVFNGLDKVHFLDRKELDGPVYELLKQAQVFLLRHLNKAARIEGVRREDVYEIPVAVLRELIANAILHRNYLVHGYIQISIFDDRVEIVSPGGLYANLTREEMLSGNSRHRHPILADVFQRMGLVEKWGTGIRRVNELCRTNGLKQPLFEVTSDSVKVTIWRNSSPRNKNAQVLSMRERAIAEYIERNPGTTVRELADIFNISKSTVSRITKKIKN